MFEKFIADPPLKLVFPFRVLQIYIDCFLTSNVQGENAVKASIYNKHKPNILLLPCI